MKNAKTFSHVAIIYNPNSTGDAPTIAKNISRTLKRVISSKKVSLLPTEYAGHAKKLARSCASKYAKPLIVSVSGDGGYNEVINGVLEAVEAGKAQSPTVTIIGAGNANDHYRVVHKKRSLSEMLKREPNPIDLLKLTRRSYNRTVETHYAHSYIGVGITPRVAEELNRNKLNPLKELQIIVKALTDIRPTYIQHEGKNKAIDSLVFANISQMAKILTLTDDNSLHDGAFELVEIPHTNILGLFKTLLRASTVGLKRQPKYTNYEFTLNEDHPLQVDGELIDCKKGDRITVTVARDAIHTLL